MDSWERLACYPQGSFYPLSDGPSTRYHRITKPYFRTCSSCLTRSQAPFCLYTLRAISGRAEGTFGRLRYSFGGDRPSQTARRQCPNRYTFRAGRNLPDKEFRYLRTVIVTAAVHRGFGRMLWLPEHPSLTFRHWAGVSTYTSAFALAGT